MEGRRNDRGGGGLGLPGAAARAHLRRLQMAGRSERAKRPAALGRSGSCSTCGSLVAANPPRAAMRRHAWGWVYVKSHP